MTEFIPSVDEATGLFLDPTLHGNYFGGGSGGTVVEGNAPGIAVAPSGDTSGATDKAAIQQAITDLSAKTPKGGVVYLEGVYYINGLILLDTSIHLAGSGWESTQIHLAAGSNSSMIGLVGGTLSTARWYTISNMSLDGHKEDQTTGGPCVDFRGAMVGAAYANCAYGFAYRVYVQYAWSHGFWIDHVENRTEECFTYRCGTATNLASGFLFAGSDQWIINCTNGESTNNGIVLTGGSSGHRMIGCKSWWSGYQATSRTQGTTKTQRVNTSASNYSIGGRNHMVAECEGQDASNAAFNISAHDCTLRISCDISTTVHVLLRGIGNRVEANIGDGTDHGTTPAVVSVWDTATSGNLFRSNFNPAKTNLGVTQGVIGGGATLGLNEISIGSPGVIATTAYAATTTPDPFMGGVDVTLTGNVTIANTLVDRKGHGMEFEVVLTQDATGGRTVTFETDYLGVTAADTTAGKVNRWRFRCHKDKWIQVGRVTY